MMQKKLLLTLGLCLTLGVVCASGSDGSDSDTDVFVSPRGYEPQSPPAVASGDEAFERASNASAGSYYDDSPQSHWDIFGDVSEYFKDRKDKGSNASFARWASIVLASTGNASAVYVGQLLARVPELRRIMQNSAMPRAAKGLIGLMLLDLSSSLPVTEGATDLQKSTAQLFAQMQQQSVFVDDNRGKLRFSVEQFSALRRDPDFQATTNALLYALTGELGITMLGGGDGMSFIKDLLLPLAIFRSRHKRFLPGTMRFMFENTFRYLTKSALTFMTGGDDKFAKEFLTFCADTLSLFGLVSTEQVKHMEDKDVKLGKIFEEWIFRVRGKASKNSAKLMSSAKDCFVNVGEAAYPRSFYTNGLQGALDIASIAEQNRELRDYLRATESALSRLHSQIDVIAQNADDLPAGLGRAVDSQIAQARRFVGGIQQRLSGDVFLAGEGTLAYQRQLEGWHDDLRSEIAGLKEEKEKKRVLLQKRSPLLGSLIS